MRWYDDLAVLPERDREWSADARTLHFSDEHMAIWSALRVLATHAVEGDDRRMAGRVLAAAVLTGTNAYCVWQDCSNLFTTELPYDGTFESASARGQDLDRQAREFFVAGVRRRPARLLRAEARGLLFCLRWLHKAGLLDRRTVMQAEHDPWRRREGLPDGAHPNVAGVFVPVSMN